MELNNGFLLQHGRGYCAGTMTFPLAFANEEYCFLMSPCGGQKSNGGTFWAATYSKTLTSIGFYMKSGNGSWVTENATFIAIGI